MSAVVINESQSENLRDENANHRTIVDAVGIEIIIS